VAEVDGNRTRQTGIARLSRFEGGGAHQVPLHLRRAPYPATSLPHGSRVTTTVTSMKRLLMLVAFVGLAVFAVKKVQSS
jgi:hypothetical protein